MVLSILLGYIEGILIERKKHSRLILAGACCIHLGLLMYFKYIDFLIGNLNAIGLSIPLFHIALPIGISFYTFQILSYLIDVYRKDCTAQTNLISFGAYVSMFPQLIAGPIVRYKDIAAQLEVRKHSVEKAALGIRKFILGLSKKVLLANSLGALCSTFQTSTDRSVLYYWLYAFSFALQIYFDFSGYSDMAVGLGNIFGFHFPDNFHYPYLSRSVTEFWRRWHITLGSWFRDYVYIPMGGNRVKKSRWFFNIAVVWFLTGLWHGASWNFVMWGLYYGVLLIIEKFVIGDRLEKVPGIFRHLYSLLFVMIGWVFFFSPTLGSAWKYLGVMFGIGAKSVLDSMGVYLFITNLILFLIAAVGSTEKVHEIFEEIVYGGWKVRAVSACVIYAGMFLLSIAYLVTETYNPFLYFRF